MTAIGALEARLNPLYARLADHRLYRSFRTVEDLRLFQETHVFAVWDFMSLLKALQRALTSVEVPWLPTRSAVTRRLVNEIVLGEESDVYEGRPASHFELYLEAMELAGADRSAIDGLVKGLRKGASWREAMQGSGASEAAKAFVEVTFRRIEEGKIHSIAAAFTFGREDLIPEMFRGFIRDQDEQLQGRLSLFRWYLDRHIEVDGDEHGPMALQMIAELCGDDAEKWSEATEAAEEAILARIALWDAIADSIASRSGYPTP
jgi:hypothetical protein